jgi:rhodanese-related sulfurtransferase
MSDITCEELKKRLDNGESPTIIDVREPYEYEEYNIGGQLIPLGEIPSKINDLQHLKQQEIIVHCRSGARSNNAKLFLMENGFANVRNLLGGMMKWQELNG